MKFKNLLILFSCLIFCHNLMAQTHPLKKNIVSFSVGSSFNQATSYGVKSSFLNGYACSVIDQISINQSRPFYFQTGLIMIRKGYKIQGFDDSKTILDYLNIPLGLNYQINVARHLNVIPSADLYIGTGLNSVRTYQNTKTNIFKEKIFSRFDFGYDFGAILQIFHFSIGVKYALGLINIDRKDDIYADKTNLLGYREIKNRSLMILLGYNF